MLMTDDTLPNAEQTFVSRLLAQLPDLADCVAAAKRLYKLLRKRRKETPDNVLEDAGGTALGEFVPSLRRDLSAVRAVRDRPWTTSSADGQINWLKILPPASPSNPNPPSALTGRWFPLTLYYPKIADSEPRPPRPYQAIHDTLQGQTAFAPS
jgi:hypothetical protein